MFLLCIFLSNTIIQIFAIHNNIWFNRSRCIILSYIATTFFYVGNILDILLIIDRLAMFNYKYKPIALKLKSYRSCFIGLLLICLIINLPSLLRFESRNANNFLDDTMDLLLKQTNKTFAYCKKRLFFEAFPGSLFILVSILIRDLIILVIEVYFTISSMI